MKKKSIILNCIVFALTAFCTKSMGQFNVNTNSYDNIQKLETPKTNYKNSVSISGITCNPNGFFGVRSNGSIDEFSLNGTTISFTNSILTGSNITSLAYCNNLNSSFSKTFYSSSSITGTYSPKYYDGVSWINSANTLTNTLNNCGGNENNLYFSSNYKSSVYSRKIVKYDGTSFTEIYARENRVIAVADLSVDDGGNVWFLSGTDSLNFVCDSIIEISPNGEILKQLPFSYNCYNAYGSFILNNVFYVAFGPSNVFTPNKLLPIYFLSNVLVTGNLITMPANNYTDLASCNAGYPLGIKGSRLNVQQIKIFPNPTNEILNIEIDILNVNNSKLQILNSLGQIVNEEKIKDQKSIINLSHFPSGVYTLKVFLENDYKAFKIIKE